MISILNFTFGSSVTVEEYNALRAAVGWRILSTRQARCTVENSAFLVTALHEGKVVGMARAITDGGYVAYIGDVMVHPDFQRQGLGKKMIRRLLDRLRAGLEEGDFIQVTLVAAKDKEPFYESLGFSRLPHETRGAGMRLEIEKA